MRIETNFDHYVDVKKDNLERLNDASELLLQLEVEEMTKPPRRLGLRVIAILLIALLLGGSIAGGLYYYLNHQVTYGQFTFSNGTYRYTDDDFDIISYGILDELNLAAINDLQYKKDRVLEMMDHDSMSQVTIVFYDDRDEYFYAGGLDHALGIYKDGSIHILHPEAKGIAGYSSTYDNFNSYQYTNMLLVHEYVHAVHEDKAGGFPANKWITEGIAEYITYKLAGVNWMSLKQYHDGQVLKTKSFNSLDFGYEYEYGPLLIDYLVQTYGERVLDELILNPELGEEERIEQITGEPHDTFYENWKAFMLEEFGMSEE